MKRTVKLSLALFIPLLLFLAITSAQTPSPSEKLKTTAAPSISRSVVDINNISMWIQNDGVGSFSPSKDWGLIYPPETAGLASADNLLWIGKVQDGQEPVFRIGGGLWSAGTAPGVILSKGVAENPASESVRVFRIRKDFRTADLTRDAADVFSIPLSAVTLAMGDSLRSQYEKDWKEWPWQKGAPFIDLNKNGVMDGSDSPDFMNAHQLIWCAYNDLNDSLMRSFQGRPPIGIEVQVTMWAYENVPNLQDIVFKRYRIIYKGTSSTPPTSAIDSMYVSQFAETDVGSFDDDLGGCDTTLSLGFAYNATSSDRAYSEYNLSAPAVGFALLQGPVVPGAPTDEALFGGGMRRGLKNLPMTSFMLKPTPSAIAEPGPGNATITPQIYWWNVVRGYYPVQGPYDPAPRPWVDHWGNETKFPLAGDPVTRQGWIDGLGVPSGAGWVSSFFAYPGGRRFYLNTGPFHMALGDTQEVVVAVVCGAASDPLSSVRYVKNRVKYVRDVYPDLARYVAGVETEGNPPDALLPYEFALEQNYPNPFNPSTTIRYAIPIDANVKLAIYDALGREIRVLQSGRQSAGSYNVVWDSHDSQNRLVPSGVYLYRLTANYLQLTRKMIIVR